MGFELCLVTIPARQLSALDQLFGDDIFAIGLALRHSQGTYNFRKPSLFRFYLQFRKLVATLDRQGCCGL